jgi:hypothetical protein
MAAPSEEKLIGDTFNLEALTVNQMKSFKALATLGGSRIHFEDSRFNISLVTATSLPVHVSNQKTFYTEHMLLTKCKQRCHFTRAMPPDGLSKLRPLDSHHRQPIIIVLLYVCWRVENGSAQWLAKMLYLGISSKKSMKKIPAFYRLGRNQRQSF